jgi:cold shock CspA family protein
VNGKMLWFNEVRGEGLIESDTGERVLVDRSAFVGGAPVGRCKGREVEFTATAGQDGWVVAEASLVPERSPRRATRHNGARLLR